MKRHKSNSSSRIPKCLNAYQHRCFNLKSRMAICNHFCQSGYGTWISYHNFPLYDSFIITDQPAGTLTNHAAN